MYQSLLKRAYYILKQGLLIMQGCCIDYFEINSDFLVRKFGRISRMIKNQIFGRLVAYYLKWLR